MPINVQECIVVCMVMKRIVIRVNQAQWDLIDRARGDVSRAEFIRQAALDNARQVLWVKP